MSARNLVVCMILIGLSGPRVVAQEPAIDPAASLPIAERLWYHRNLGKAFYENPTTQYEAVGEFKKALDLAPDSARERLNYGLSLLRAGKTAEALIELERVTRQDPALPHAWFNWGIALKRESQYEAAIAKLEKMAALVPDEPITLFNLATLYKLTGAPDKALPLFEAAARLAPALAGPRFQLYNAYKSLGRTEDSQRELAAFRERKTEQEGAAVPEDLEWSWYSEIFDEPEPQSEPPVAIAPQWRAEKLAQGLVVEQSFLRLLDFEADGASDLLVGTGQGLRLFKGGKTSALVGLEKIGAVVDAAPGDFDNDGMVDLAVIAKSGPLLLRNSGQAFEPFPMALPAGDFRVATWLDFDHDYDLDLFLLGHEKNVVWRNPGAGLKEGWSDASARFPFVVGAPLAALAVHTMPDSQSFDLVVAFADRPGVVYRDRLGGRFEALPLPALEAGEKLLDAPDADGDGYLDLVTSANVLTNDRKLSFRRGRALPAGAVLADFDNVGRLQTLERAAAAVVAADFDRDGRLELIEITPQGELQRLLNAVPSDGRGLSLRLEGVKNLKLPLGAEVEVKAGSLYAKQTFRGLPLIFGLGRRTSIETLRITWPNGLVQNEVRLEVQASGVTAKQVKEAPRLSGSCPMIFTWNGKEFQFVTDVLGVAPLGASLGDGQYFPVDHDEVVAIPPGALVEREGRYDLRITEELREVTYLDQVQLLAVDFPAGSEVFTNDQFRDPPFPPLEIYQFDRRFAPQQAQDDLGNDVLERVLAIDARYPDAFPRDLAGQAQTHHLELDFGTAAATATHLILHGWVDWADGSTFLQAAQRPDGGLRMPRLLVEDAAGQWLEALPSMGIPAGKPKTIVVDLANVWKSASRRVRIETNLCVYWDQIFLAQIAARPEITVAELAPASATLRFRGFSKPKIHAERKQPESFDYQTFLAHATWNPTPGLYTRFGDVNELLEAVDDRLVIFGSGDEIVLSFAAAWPAPAPGRERRLFLKVDGWAKDGDANTAFSQSVEPLPFHGMSRYPYPDEETLPQSPALDDYRRRFNTRPALRLVRPLLGEEAP